jgi:glucosamine-6-phosphate deaminase
MEIIVVEGYRELSVKAAAIVAEEIKENRQPVLGLATGSTPEGMYAQLVKMFNAKEVDFSNVITFNLDEYAGLSPEHPQSYYYYMHRNLFDHVNIKNENIHIPQCDNQSISAFCREYDQSIIAAGGIDLQILGIGGNGHIGFNEPGRSLSYFTHLIDLTEDTIMANSRFFDSLQKVPRRAVTMGMGPIMHAAKILLLASGHSKAKVIQRAFNGTITTDLPASLLQLHRDVTLLVGQEAAALIEKR